MTTKRSKNLWETVVQADLLPVMNIMFLLIPALLLAMEFASMAEIAVSPPNMCGGCEATDKKPTERPLDFKVAIRSDGYKLDVAGGPLPLIPTQAGELDYQALTTAAQALKATHADEFKVTVTAEGDVSMDRLVRTLDTLRGDGCKLADIGRGEQPGATCLFYAPVISST